jgi:D-tyrosyl-tRNA(Tyr) deacylase
MPRKRPPLRHPPPPKPKSPEEIARLVQGYKKMAGPDVNYRERSLAIHGLICAKCAREFDFANRHLLTVHHKDGNDANNPADGSNWENLCVDCHEAEHSRGRLGDYTTGRRQP